ncbi:uncharacterized protein SEPMUDRAFT_127012 [Sphaerulina musiva SO2202]|uniref:Uncharacterized protein n=1 Tax=Sphaerulina musiva (strain SO2202) TaxID=692275 RepID=M3AXM0_SPHMS|nr:uncharacterized protein SEPMUDRAFT_127012 [Sphaerulina musiva SO2202]EMF11485.1 hypothetical protein SEPMUDRAFT_127012 [Sphaerulina musiva SO2202]
MSHPFSSSHHPHSTTPETSTTRLRRLSLEGYYDTPQATGTLAVPICRIPEV